MCEDCKTFEICEECTAVCEYRVEGICCRCYNEDEYELMCTDCMSDYEADRINYAMDMHGY